MNKDLLNTRAERFFTKATAHPRTILTISILIILATASFLPRLTKNTSSDAFIPPDHPSVIYRAKVKEIFNLSAPVVVAVINEGEKNGIFNPQTLNLINWMTEQITEIEGVDPEQVTSLATENNLIGTEEGMLVEPFFEVPPETQEEALAVRQAVMDFPLYLGSLVARDGSATLIVAELLDLKKGGSVYAELLTLVEKAPRNGERLHVAGEGAVSGHLGKYIDDDAKRLNVLTALIVSAILLLTYRTARGLFLPNLVVLGAVAVALGSMAAAGVPFYVITNALPVVIIVISIADGIHILGQYYEEIAQRPNAPARDLVVRTMVEMWRPVTITSVTDLAGFLALSFASYMPPMRAFGVFASLGVIAALLISTFTLPACLVLLNPRPSRAFRTQNQKDWQKDWQVEVDRSGRIMEKLGGWVIARPRRVLAISLVAVIVGILGVVKLEVNDEEIANFKTSELLYQADRAINRTFDGTNYLDIVIETREPEVLFKPENLRRIEAAQRFFESIPHVGGTTSIVDFLKQMNRSMNENKHDAYRLPTDAETVDQYLLVYSASGAPTDFEEYVSYDYQLANLRVRLKTGRYSEIKEVVETAEQYIGEHFNAPGITANLAGQVNVNYHWMNRLSSSHVKSLVLALLAVWLMTAFSFRSVMAGVVAVLPVCMAILLIYAIMGFSGISLGVATSMFAAIAIGTSVDFSVHTIDRLMVLTRDKHQRLDQAFLTLFRSTGRALLFSFLALFLGFGVFTTSHVPPLIRFGILTGLCAFGSFSASLIVMPALIKVLRPAFLGLDRKPIRTHRDT